MRGGSALPPLTASGIYSSVLGPCKQYWTSDEQLLQPSDWCGDVLPSHAMGFGWNLYSPKQNKSFTQAMTLFFFLLFLLLCHPCAPESCCGKCAISATSACPPPVIERRRSRGWHTLSRTLCTNAGSLCTELPEPRRKVLIENRETGAGQWVQRIQRCHTKMEPRSQNSFSFCFICKFTLYAIVWDLILGHGKLCLSYFPSPTQDAI